MHCIHSYDGETILHNQNADEPQQSTKAEVSDDRSRGHSLSTSPPQPFSAVVALPPHQIVQR